MKSTFLRVLQASALGVWGVVFLYFYMTGRVVAYLHPTFHLPVFLAGAVLVLLGAGAAFSRDTVWCCERADCAERPPGALVAALGWCVLVLPLLATTSLSPSQFGATAVRNRGIVETIGQLPGIGSFEPFSSPLLPGETPHPWAGDPSMDAAGYLAMTPEGRIRTETLDLLFAAGEDALRGDFENREIEMIGQFLPPRAATKETEGTAEFQLLRVFIMCCAADARPIGVSVRVAEMPELAEMDWVRVRGVATFPVVGGKRMPVVEAEEVVPTDAPAQPFLY